MVGARVVAISTSGMPFARGVRRTIFVDSGIMSSSKATRLKVFQTGHPKSETRVFSLQKQRGGPSSKHDKWVLKTR